MYGLYDMGWGIGTNDWVVYKCPKINFDPV